MDSNRKALTTLLLLQLRKIMLFTLIIALLMILVALPPTSAEPTSEPVYLFKIVVNSNSGWTHIATEGLDPYMTHTSLIDGANISGLWYNYDKGNFSSGRAVEDYKIEVIEIDALSFKGNQSWQFSVSKGNNGYTKVTVYKFTSGSWLQLAYFENTGTNPDFPGFNTRNFTVDYNQMYNSPSSTTTIQPVPPTLEKTVFAFYYPWYLTANGPGGVTWHTESGYAHHPLLGRYDSVDERVIEAHMRLAEAAGIDCLIANFNGPGVNDEKPLPTIFKIAESLNFKVAIYECADRNLTEGEMIGELSYIINTYSSSSAYLKVDGKPVIFVYAVEAYNRDSSYWPDVVKALRDKGTPAYLIGDLIDSKYVEAFDGCHRYGAITPSDIVPIWQTFENFRLGLDGIDWDQAIGLIQQGKTLPFEERFLALPVHPGYDATKTPDYQKNYPNPYLDRKNGQTYYEYWQAAMSCKPDGILITSWNEWHEGSEIEPSVEYGFTYINLTRQFISLYKGTAPTTNSTEVEVQTDLGNVIRDGAKKASILVIDNSPSVQAEYVSLNVSLSEGLNLTQAHHESLYCYSEEIQPHMYNVVIPLIKPKEAIAFNISLVASVGAGSMNITALGYSPSGVEATASLIKQIQVVSDRVDVNLSANSSRVEVGSEAKINVNAKYDYDGQPLVGEAYLNDTLTKNSTCTCTYSTRSVSDRLHGLKDFITNTVTVTFDRIAATESVASLSPGSITPSIMLRYESNGQPVDKATVTINGMSAVEVAPGAFQATVATWNPLSQLSIHIERHGFRPQDLTLSEIDDGNITLEAIAVAIILVAIVLLARRARLSAD